MNIKFLQPEHETKVFSFGLPCTLGCILHSNICLSCPFFLLRKSSSNCLYSSEDPHKDIGELLVKYSKDPESEAQLKLLLPQIASTFSPDKSVNEIKEELKKHQLSSDSIGKLHYTLLFMLDHLSALDIQYLPTHKWVMLTAISCFSSSQPSLFFPLSPWTVSEWAKEALSGLAKGAPFSLCLTQKHFSRVALGHGKNDSDLSSVSWFFLLSLQTKRKWKQKFVC